MIIWVCVNHVWPTRHIPESALMSALVDRCARTKAQTEDLLRTLYPGVTMEEFTARAFTLERVITPARKSP